MLRTKSRPLMYTLKSEGCIHCRELLLCYACCSPPEQRLPPDKRLPLTLRLENHIFCTQVFSKGKGRRIFIPTAAAFNPQGLPAFQGPEPGFRAPSNFPLLPKRSPPVRFAPQNLKVTRWIPLPAGRKAAPTSPFHRQSHAGNHPSALNKYLRQLHGRLI